MPATKVNLSQMVDLAVGTPEVNFNVLHSLLHAMLKRLNIVDVQADLNDFDRDSSNKHLFEKTRTQYQEKPIGEMWLNMKLESQVETNEKGISKVWLILDSFPHIYRLIGLSLICCVTGTRLYLCQGYRNCSRFMSHDHPLLTALVKISFGKVGRAIAYNATGPGI